MQILKIFVIYMKTTAYRKESVTQPLESYFKKSATKMYYNPTVP